MKTKSNLILLLSSLLVLSSCNKDNTVKDSSSKDSTSSTQDSTSTSEVESSSDTETSSSVESSSTSSSQESSTSTKVECEEGHHVYPDKDDYICFQECEVCGHTGKNVPTNSFVEDFKFDETTYSSDDYDAAVLELEAITDLVATAKTASNLSELNSEVEDRINAVADTLDSLILPYHYSEVMSYKYNNDLWNDLNEEIYAHVVDLENKIYSLEYKIFKSDLKSYYFAGYTDEEIEEMYGAYADETIGKLEASIKTLENQAYFEDLSDTTKFADDVYELITMRNDLAKKFGYDNYYDYAYAEVYARCYDASLIKDFRAYVKEYLVPLLADLEAYYSSHIMSVNNKALQYFYNPIFENQSLLKTASDYFKYMDDEVHDVNMYDAVNNYFKEGRIFIGESGQNKEAAFTNFLGDLGNYLFFANEDYYAAIETVVHEVGHSMLDSNYFPLDDYDLYETHSQSNEALFVNYLSKEMAPSSFKYLEFFYTYNLVSTIVSTCMIDEIEECLYTNSCSYSDRFSEGIKKVEYNLLARLVMRQYDISTDESWKYYFTQSSCYCVSYGVSVLPCYGLFISSKKDAEKAKESYFNTLYFYQNDDYDTYFASKECNYLNVLEYCGYYSPFDEELFKLVAENAVFN